MRFAPTDVDGVLVVDIEPREDDRGFFARVFCQEEFAAAGLPVEVAQRSIAWNARAGTVRGMHLEVAPSREAKLVRCTAGALVDCALDLRPGSPTYLRHVMVELSAANRRALYIPPGCAHGYQTLVDATEAEYQMNDRYQPELERGWSHADPAFGLVWPRPVTVISPRDASWPAYAGPARTESADTPARAGDRPGARPPTDGSDPEESP